MLHMYSMSAPMKSRMPPHDPAAAGCASCPNWLMITLHDLSSVAEASFSPVAHRYRVSRSLPMPSTLYQHRTKVEDMLDTGPASSNSMRGRCHRRSDGSRPCNHGCNLHILFPAALDLKFSQKPCTPPGFAPMWTSNLWVLLVLNQWKRSYGGQHERDGAVWHIETGSPAIGWQD